MKTMVLLSINPEYVDKSQKFCYAEFQEKMYSIREYLGARNIEMGDIPQIFTIKIELTVEDREEIQKRFGDFANVLFMEGDFSPITIDESNLPYGYLKYETKD